jgi:hypothetical protein
VSVKQILSVVFTLLLLCNSSLSAADIVMEPKKIAAASKLKADEGAVRLSVRTQSQYTETFFLYFVQLSKDGGDSEKYFRIERGAGVPIAGSNMIDVKANIYKFPAGRYRLAAYTMRCEGVPKAGMQCVASIGGALPTGYYSAPSPEFEVKSGGFTDAGDYIYEYVGPLQIGEVDQHQDFSKGESQIRWKPLTMPVPSAFAALLVTTEVTSPIEFKSRIKCETRPKGVMLFIPFSC